MKHITSRDNPHIKHISKLKRSKVYRREHGECVVEGERSIHSFLKSQHHIIAVYVQEDIYRTTIVDIDSDHIIIVPDHVMDKMSTAQTPSGIVAHIKLRSWATNTIQPGLCLVHIADPGNMGTLIRTSIALGYTTITTIDCVDPWNPKSVQASAGTIAHAYIHDTQWQTVQTSKQVTTYALTAHDADPITSVKLENPLILVGNEAHGLPHHIIDDANYRVQLYMPGQAESYNAATAGSIALYMMTYRMHNAKGI